MTRKSIAFIIALFCIPEMQRTNAQVLISEIRIDQTGPDNDEYFELSGAPGFSLDGLSYVVIGDGAGGSGVIEVAVDLTGLSLAPDGYWFAAESSFTLGPTPDLVTSLNFENGDNFTHLLVSGFSGANNDDLDTDDNGVLDVIPWSGILDGVSLIMEPNPPTTSEYSYAAGLGYSVVGPDGAAVPGHVYRDDQGDWQIGPMDVAAGLDTPGTAVPEPSTWALLGAGALAGLFWRRRK